MSMSEVELRKQAELRMWQDRIEALKQAGLMPELTESVIGLIQEKVATLEQEKVEEQTSNLPEPSIQISQSGPPPEGSSKIKLAQQVQREDAPAPESNPMLDFLADLSDQQAPKLPELPKAPEQAQPTTAAAAKEPTEPVPEAKPAIPSEAAKGTEPLLLAKNPEVGLQEAKPPAPAIQIEPGKAASEPALSFEPAKTESPDKPTAPAFVNQEKPEPPPTPEQPKAQEPEANPNAPDATGPIQSGRQEFDVPIRTGRQPFDVPIRTGRQPYEVPKRDPEDQPIISGRQPFDVPRREVPEQRIDRVVDPVDSPSLSTGTDNVQKAVDALDVGSSEIREQAGLPPTPQRPTTMSPPPPQGQPKKNPELQDRRDKALRSKPEVPRDAMSPEMLERYKQVQARQAFSDDSSLRIGGGLFPNATPGGNQISVSTQQDKLGIATETANSQLGALLERLAREHASLVVHIREANRILDESQY